MSTAPATAVRAACPPKPAAASEHRPDEKSAVQPAPRPRQQPLDGQRGAMPRRIPQHVRKALSSPTDGIQSPATKAINSMHRKARLPKPQVLESVFAAMKPKAAAPAAPAVPAALPAAALAAPADPESRD
ncbi:hypothetical protein H4R19_004458 [Coemansia spiralis]|nr:hypothetical protein H4R19_004458 [Coemansia spiralis]